ncbi:MAG TPA: helix-turn-helix transcriptional regulator [Streptosporangiaceae bacterium]|nr:helix-turn-helix transcriptional regulator [Streptosporangiaceae bacterium]
MTQRRIRPQQGPATAAAASVIRTEPDRRKTTRLDFLSDSEKCRPVSFTDRETSIICLIAAGLTNAQVAWRLCISHHTVAQHVAEMLRRSSARNRCELVARAYAVGSLRTGVWPPRHSNEY